MRSYGGTRSRSTRLSNASSMRLRDANADRCAAACCAYVLPPGQARCRARRNRERSTPTCCSSTSRAGARWRPRRRGGPWASWCPHTSSSAFARRPAVWGLGCVPRRAPRIRDYAPPPPSGGLGRIVKPRVNESASAVAFHLLRMRRVCSCRCRCCCRTTAEPFEYPRSDWPSRVRLGRSVRLQLPAQLPTKNRRCASRSCS